MLVSFECSRCHWVKLEPTPYHSGMTLCEACRRSVLPGGKPPPPPPMRTPIASLKPSAGSMLVVLVFLSGLAVGAKLAGAW
ncbi:hypothetical protein SAMN03159391_05819 [Pseudomonas sp. NFACC37-1]|nr:hypothetical protein SAMN03159391_05819 [Pseudomonas sp. NFACC37-1]